MLAQGTAPCTRLPQQQQRQLRVVAGRARGVGRAAPTRPHQQLCGAPQPRATVPAPCLPPAAWWGAGATHSPPRRVCCAAAAPQRSDARALQQQPAAAPPAEAANGNGRGSAASARAPAGRAVSVELDERQEAALAAAEVDPCLGYNLEATDWSTASLSVVVLGASGDLAKKKIFPALFALFYEGLLPENVQLFGYARSKMSDEAFREMIAATLTCRIDARERCADAQEKFLQRCFYQAGPYDGPEGFAALSQRLSELEAHKPRANRMFFLSIPPNVFLPATGNATEQARSKTGWTRVIVEKPFGRDSASSRELGRGLSRHLSEDEIYRIDHYLGKELIENLTVLRFGNRVFEPLWSRQYIRNVQIIFSENFGTQGRGGYFDQYGIIRDVIQNHLLQILALFAMEQPVSLDAEDIRNEKVKVLRSMKVVTSDDVIMGQYKARGSNPGYLDDPTVPTGSTTPTFAAVSMFINNHRWEGVPFLLKAGKALHKRYAEVRVQFWPVPGNLYRDKQGADPDASCNELVIRIQPKEAIYLKINNKVPGLGLRLDQTKLDLQYGSTYTAHELPDAYERLLLDVVNGDKRLFIRSDELEAAWELYTPVLHALEAAGASPELYPYGSRGPLGAHYLAAKYGVRWGDLQDDDGDE